MNGLSFEFLFLWNELLTMVTTLPLSRIVLTWFNLSAGVAPEARIGSFRDSETRAAAFSVSPVS